jgi:hypothetical protein
MEFGRRASDGVVKRGTAIFLVVALLLTISEATSAAPPVSGFNVAPQCSLSQRTQQNDNSLVEVNVMYENGSYIRNAEINAKAYWWTVRLLNQTWNYPLICLTAIATQETVFWTIQVNGFSEYRWVWAPTAVGEHQLAYVTYPTGPGDVSIHIFDANSIAATSLPEFSPIAAVMLMIIALSVVTVVNRNLHMNREKRSSERLSRRQRD